MKHKHYDMIVAKAANMELVVFVKNEEWEACHETVIPYHSKYEYFICLPQHREACLHWLNGGEVQTDSGLGGDFCDAYPFSDYSGKWCHSFWYVLPDYQSRIKPRKEKRWIAYGTNSQKMGVRTFSSEKSCKEQYDDVELNGPVQYFEIEVEV